MEKVAENINAILASVSALVWGSDQIRDYVTQALTERLAGVPEDGLVMPSLTVAGPTMEALRYAGHDVLLRELYANLLATAMNARTTHLALPAFVEIIRQLTSDEARLLGLLGVNQPLPLISVRVNYKRQLGGYSVLRHFSLLGYEAGCAYPDLTPSYLENLCRLGVAEIPATGAYTVPGIYEPLERHPKIVDLVSDIDRKPDKKSFIERQRLRVTNLGRHFCEACVGDPDRG